MVNRYEKDSVQEVLEAISSFRMSYSVINSLKGEELERYARYNEQLVMLLFRFLETMRTHNNDEEREGAVDALQSFVVEALGKL